jgi:hypothetical protein
VLSGFSSWQANFPLIDVSILDNRVLSAEGAPRALVGPGGPFLAGLLSVTFLSSYAFNSFTE